MKPNQNFLDLMHYVVIYSVLLLFYQYMMGKGMGLNETILWGLIVLITVDKAVHWSFKKYFKWKRG